MVVKCPFYEVLNVMDICHSAKHMVRADTSNPDQRAAGMTQYSRITLKWENVKIPFG